MYLRRISRKFEQLHHKTEKKKIQKEKIVLKQFCGKINTEVDFLCAMYIPIELLKTKLLSDQQKLRHAIPLKLPKKLF